MVIKKLPMVQNKKTFYSVSVLEIFEHILANQTFRSQAEASSSTGFTPKYPHFRSNT